MWILPIVAVVLSGFSDSSRSPVGLNRRGQLPFGFSAAAVVLSGIGDSDSCQISRQREPLLPYADSAKAALALLGFQ